MVKRHSDKIINTTQKGFTLIELLVVVAIIGILAAVGVVAFSGLIKSSKEVSCKGNFQNIIRLIPSELLKCNFNDSPEIVIKLPAVILQATALKT